MLSLYAITDDFVSVEERADKVEKALRGGATMLQLREKHLPEEDFIAEARKIKEICSVFGVPLIINDNVSVAIKSGADGVHVGATDMPVAEVRKIVPHSFIVGATAKTVSQALAAQADGADYLGVGAVFGSVTKTDAVSITIDRLKAICNAANIPVAAIGGINIDNVLRLKGCGIAGIAVVSALFSAPDITAAARELKAKVQTILMSDKM